MVADTFFFSARFLLRGSNEKIEKGKLKEVPTPTLGKIPGGGAEDIPHF
jgi:hypothetical protein